MRIGKRTKRQRNPKRILRPDETIPIKVPERIEVDLPVKVPALVPREVNTGAE